MKRSTKIVIGLAVVGGIVLTFAPGPILKKATLRALQQATGFEVSYTAMTSNPWRRTVDIDGLLFKNPPDFPEADAIEIKHLHARFRWRDLLGDAVKLEELQLDVPRVVMVRKPDGETNLERMQDHARAQKKASRPVPPPVEIPVSAPVEPAETVGAALTNAALTESKEVASVPEPASSTSRPELHIGTLTLKLGRVEIHDYGRMKKGKPRKQEYDLHVDRTFQDVTDLDAVGQQLAAQVLIQEGLRAVNEQLQDPEAMEKLGKSLEKVLGNFLK